MMLVNPQNQKLKPKYKRSGPRRKPWGTSQNSGE